MAAAHTPKIQKMVHLIDIDLTLIACGRLREEDITGGDVRRNAENYTRWEGVTPKKKYTT